MTIFPLPLANKPTPILPTLLEKDVGARRRCPSKSKTFVSISSYMLTTSNPTPHQIYPQPTPPPHIRLIHHNSSLLTPPHLTSLFLCSHIPTPGPLTFPTGSLPGILNLQRSASCSDHGICLSSVTAADAAFATLKDAVSVRHSHSTEIAGQKGGWLTETYRQESKSGFQSLWLRG